MYLFNSIKYFTIFQLKIISRSYICRSYFCTPILKISVLRGEYRKLHFKTEKAYVWGLVGGAFRGRQVIAKLEVKLLIGWKNLNFHKLLSIDISWTLSINGKETLDPTHLSKNEKLIKYLGCDKRSAGRSKYLPRRDVSGVLVS